MKKLKYQGGLTRLIASEIAKRNKKRFARFIERNLFSLAGKIAGNKIPIQVVSFSSKKDFFDQVLSILSFLRFVGIPLHWTIYSDGSHDSEQTLLLTSGFEFAEVKMTDLENEEALNKNCKEELLPYLHHLLCYARVHPLGKKLFHYLNHPVKHPTLFLDSDILFYPKASMLHLLLNENRGWYLPDSGWGCLDTRYIKTNPAQCNQLNSGFIFLNKELSELKKGLDFLKNLNYQYEYFTEQTVFHILSGTNGLSPLDPRFFILNSGDQFDFSYLYAKDIMAIRHYTGPVRHKMWQKNWKWQLSLS